jgi:hypothetical protein
VATQVELNGVLEITSISADWDYKASKPAGWPNRPQIASVQFNPGAADDELMIREQESGGPERFFSKCENAYDQRCKYYFGNRIIPYIVFSESTLSAGHKVVIELWRGDK